MSKTHSLVFKNYVVGKSKKIVTIDGCRPDKDVLSDAMLSVRTFCEAHGFDIPYIQVWNQDGDTVFDVGSHSEFFYLIPSVDIIK